jgi:hypothetical protein
METDFKQKRGNQANQLALHNDDAAVDGQLATA